LLTTSNIQLLVDKAT